MDYNYIYPLVYRSGGWVPDTPIPLDRSKEPADARVSIPPEHLDAVSWSRRKLMKVWKAKGWLPNV